MQVYSVLLSVDYEGMELLGVFASHEEAVVFARSHPMFGQCRGGVGVSYGVLACELGCGVDAYDSIEWVE